MLLCTTKQGNKTIPTSLVPNHSHRVTPEKEGQLTAASATYMCTQLAKTQEEEQQAEAVSSQPSLPTSTPQRRQYLLQYLLRLIFF